MKIKPISVHAMQRFAYFDANQSQFKHSKRKLIGKNTLRRRFACI